MIFSFLVLVLFLFATLLLRLRKLVKPKPMSSANKFKLLIFSIVVVTLYFLAYYKLDYWAALTVVCIYLPVSNFYVRLLSQKN